MSCIPQSKENYEFCFHYLLKNRDTATLVCSLYVVAVIFRTCVHSILFTWHFQYKTYTAL